MTSRSNIINSRADLDALEGTPAHEQFMALLASSLWRLERDDANERWIAIEDNSTINKFGFVREDFPNATAPDFPVWEPVDNNVKSITKLQFVEWCETNNKLSDFTALLDSDAVLKLKWDAALSLEVDHPLVVGAAQALGVTDVQAVFNEIGND